MNKEAFKKHFEASMSKVEINVQLKKNISNHLFPMKSQKNPFWTWTKAIFTVPVAALIVIIFILNSSQEVVKQVLSPQQTLARALENTFHLGSFETTFGLPDDGKLYYRKIRIGQSEHLISTENNGGVDLWTDGINLRAQTSGTGISNSAAEGFGESFNYYSVLTAPEEGQFCFSSVYLFIPDCANILTPDQQVFCNTSPTPLFEERNQCDVQPPSSDDDEILLQYFQADLFLPVSLMTHKINLDHPDNIKKVKRNGQMVMEYTYNNLDLPQEMKVGYASRHQPKDFILHLFLSEDQTKFMGYSRVTKPDVEKYWQPNQELEFFWIEDEILPDSKKAILTEEQWQEVFEEEKNKIFNKKEKSIESN